MMSVACQREQNLTSFGDLYQVMSSTGEVEYILYI